MKDKQLASIIEARGASEGHYPAYWPVMSKQVKALAGWCCERCGVRNNEDGPDGTMLTVHHLDGNKWNCEWWNLAALCQRCHLRIQARVDFYNDILDGTHSLWLARHIKGYNVEMMLVGGSTLTLNKITERSYENEWPAPKPRFWPKVSP